MRMQREIECERAGDEDAVSMVTAARYEFALEKCD